MSKFKQSLKQTGESTADKKAKITREERALTREQEKLWKEKKRTIKRAVKGQDKLKRIRDKATLIVPESIGNCKIIPTPVHNLSSLIEAGL